MQVNTMRLDAHKVIENAVEVVKANTPDTEDGVVARALVNLLASMATDMNRTANALEVLVRRGGL